MRYESAPSYLGAKYAERLATLLSVASMYHISHAGGILPLHFTLFFPPRPYHPLDIGNDCSTMLAKALIRF